MVCFWLISIPFLIRSIFDFVKIPSKFDIKFYEDSIDNNDFRYPLFWVFYFMIVDLIPAGSQIVALKFAINQNDQLSDNTFKNVNRTEDTTFSEYKTSSGDESQGLLKSITSKRQESD